MVRIKNRYLLVNILYPQDMQPPTNHSSTNGIDFLKLYQPTSDSLTPQVLSKTIKNTVLDLYGDYGLGAISGSLQVKYLSPATSTFILKVSRAYYRIVWAALTNMHEIPGGKRCIFRVVRCCGTIRKAEEDCIARSRALGVRARKELGERVEKDLEDLFGGGGKEEAFVSGDVDINDDESEESGDGD